MHLPHGTWATFDDSQQKKLKTPLLLHGKCAHSFFHPTQVISGKRITPSTVHGIAHAPNVDSRRMWECTLRATSFVCSVCWAQFSSRALENVCPARVIRSLFEKRINFEYCYIWRARVQSHLYCRLCKYGRRYTTNNPINLATEFYSLRSKAVQTCLRLFRFLLCLPISRCSFWMR